MAATVIEIADAVVAALNAANLSQSFTAERFYVPVYDLKGYTSLKLSVVPASLEGTLLDRGGRNLYTYVIDVGIQKSIGRGQMSNAQIVAACDPLMVLCEEVADLFDGKALAGYERARCTDVANEPIYAPLVIDESKVFMSLITLTFRLGR